MIRAKRDLRRATRLAFGAWKANLGYGILVGIVVAVLLGPAVSWLLFKGLEIAAGGTVLNYDITAFVLSPAGILVFLLWTTLTALVAVVSLGGHVYVAAAQAAGKAVSLPRVIQRVLLDLPRVPGFGAIKLALLSALLAPIVAASVGAAGGLLLAPISGERVFENLPTGRPLWILLGVGAAVFALGFWLYIRWSLTMSAFCLEGKALAASTRASRDRVCPVFWGVARAHILHHFTWGLLIGVITLGLGGLLRPVLKWVLATNADAALWVVAAALVFVSAVLGFLAIFGVARVVALTVVHHTLLGGGVAVGRFTVKEGDLEPKTRRSLTMILGGALVLFVVGTVLTLPHVEHELSLITSPPTVTAHRGSSIEAPQNTLAALRLAIQDGADVCEFDVHQAKDGTLVVFHDENLQRLAGIDRNIFDMTGEELAQAAVEGEPVPTLQQFLQEAKGKIRLNVELKVHGHETPTYAADALEMLRQEGMFEASYITSLDLAILREVRRLEKDLPIGMIITAKVGSASALDCDIYSTQRLIATSAFIRKAHAEGREVHVWTLNDAEDMVRYADRGVDSIITDLPRKAKALYAKRTEGDELRAAIRRLFD